MKQLYEKRLEAEIHASAQDVFKSLIETFQPVTTAVQPHVDIDATQRQIILQGDWWYRGVYRVESRDKNSQLIYEVYNIASPSTRWLVPLIRGHHWQPRHDFSELAAQVGKRLGCKVQVS